MTETSETELRAEIERLRGQLLASEQREQALRESEARLQLMVDGSGDGGWDWNVSTGEAYMSPGWFRLLGYEPGELPSNAETWNRLMHPDDAPRVWARLTPFLEGLTHTYEIENRMLHKSGRIVWILSRAKVFSRDEQGRPIRMTGTLRDITARRAAEEDLRRSQALLLALIDNSPAVIYVRDRDGRFLLGNKRIADLMGVERDQIIGRADHELVPPEAIAAFRKTDDVIFAGGPPLSVEEVVQHPDGLRIYFTTKFPIHDDDGRCVAVGGISTDITERKRAEEERTALQERLIAAQRAALRELSTPLIPIAEDVVVMPLIGTIDSQRAQQLMEGLLAGVASHRARTVIIDVTGVQVVDTAVANALVQASRAVRLLGAEVVLTGIRPEVAMTFVSMGADLGDMVVHGSLRNGIAHALGGDQATRKVTRR